MAIFGERLKKLRKEKGVTQKQVAEAIGTTERAIRRYEAGNGKPRFEVITAISDYFKVPTDYFLRLSDETDSDESILLSFFQKLDKNDRQTLFKFAEFLCGKDYLLGRSDNPQRI